MTPDPSALRAALLAEPLVTAAVAVAPGQVYLVGGAVRDLLLGRPTHDLDLVVAGSLDQVAQAVGDRLHVRAAAMGRPPMATYRLAHRGVILDLACLPGAIEEDLARRDLTINALGLELTAPRGNQAAPERIVDPWGGLDDLAARVVRFVSEEVVTADPLRLLRLFRFAATLDFALDSASLDLVRRHAALIGGVAGERIWAELYALLGAPRSAHLLRIMADSGLLTTLIPEMAPMRGCGQEGFHHLDVFDHTLAAVAALEDFQSAPGFGPPDLGPELDGYLTDPSALPLLKMALLCHDLGKPGTRLRDERGVHFYGHEESSAEMARKIMTRVRASKADQDLVALLIGQHMRLFHLFQAERTGHLTRKAVFRLHRDLGRDVWGLAWHALADAAATQGPAADAQGGLLAFTAFLGSLGRELASQKTRLASAPGLVSGMDIMKTLDLGPGPEIGRLLGAIEEARALGQVSTREEALALARDLVDRP